MPKSSNKAQLLFFEIYFVAYKEITVTINAQDISNSN